jgi:sphingomyelin phosphodiesterase
MKRNLRMTICVLLLAGAALSGLPGRASAPERLTILTHNVYTVLGAPGIDERLALIAASDYLRGYDVVILTELFNDSASDRLLEALRADYPYQTPVVGRASSADPDCAANECWTSIDGAFREQRPEDGGVAILSKWPIVERRQLIFTASCGIDALTNKGFAYAQIDIHGTLVHIVGTHMQADPTGGSGVEAQLEKLFPCSVPAFDAEPSACPMEWASAFEAVRLAQLMEIDAWIERQGIPREQMVVIGGDLNVDKVGNPAEYDRMLCALHASAPLYGGDPVLPEPRYTWDGLLNALLNPEVGRLYLDYILLRDDHAQPAQWRNYVLRVTASPDNWSDGETRGYEFSDHFPVAGFVDEADSPRRAQ